LKSGIKKIKKRNKTMKKKKLKTIKKEVSIPKQYFNSEVIAVIKQTIARDLTDPELKVYLNICRKYNADPIMKDIVPVPFNTKKGRVLNFIVTRDFLLKKANENGILDGMHSEIIRNKDGNIIGAKCEAWKKGSSHSFKVEVDFKEYYNDKNELWMKYPGAMIRKVAESIILKQLQGISGTGMITDAEVEKDEIIPNTEIPSTTKTKFQIADNGEVKTEIIDD
jgi:phage recombination protein Bet